MKEKTSDAGSFEARRDGTHSTRTPRAALRLAAASACAALLASGAAEARVSRIVVDTVVSPAFNAQSFGSAGPYETLAGRAFGELDPADPHNAIIQDINLAPRNANGRVEYMATFFIVKPVDMARSSRLLWHDVPNRGGRITIAAFDRNNGDIGLSSGWQGDQSGATVPGASNDYVIVPTARNPDGSPVTGPLLGRIQNASGPTSQRIIVFNNPLPYRPLTLDTSQAELTTRASESPAGAVGATATVASSDWAWASCSATNPFPGTPDPTQICLRNGFDPALLYQVRFTATDPYVLGIGFAAFRDVGSFFRYASQDDAGTPNPLAGGVSWSIVRGASQSGNFIRSLLNLDFNQDEARRQVYDAAWPTIAGGRLALNVRFGLPDNAARLYDAARETPTWWMPWPDPLTGMPPRGILDRCRASATCPKIVETFGATEFWYLKFGHSLVGTLADADIPLSRSIRRYYIPSTTHGGGAGGFNVNPPAVPSGSGANWGQCLLNGNPVPHTETRNAITVHLRNWVIAGTPPPPSRYPTLTGGNLVAPDKNAMGFPTIPGLPATAPTGLVNPHLVYDFGPNFRPEDESGVIDNVPPIIKGEIKMVVPRVDADGNELGGVPVVLRDAPLGTYLGWNITASGFRAGQICSFTGGMIPFARTMAERLAKNDPRLSLEERYGTHEGYVNAVRAAAANAVQQGFLLQADADALITAAQASNVLQ